MSIYTGDMGDGPPSPEFISFGSEDEDDDDSDLFPVIQIPNNERPSPDINPVSPFYIPSENSTNDDRFALYGIGQFDFTSLEERASNQSIIATVPESFRNSSLDSVSTVARGIQTSNYDGAENINLSPNQQTPVFDHVSLSFLHSQETSNEDSHYFQEVESAINGTDQFESPTPENLSSNQSIMENVSGSSTNARSDADLLSDMSIQTSNAGTVEDAHVLHNQVSAALDSIRIIPTNLGISNESATHVNSPDRQLGNGNHDNVSSNPPKALDTPSIDKPNPNKFEKPSTSALNDEGKTTEVSHRCRKRVMSESTSINSGVSTPSIIATDKVAEKGVEINFSMLDGKDEDVIHHTSKRLCLRDVSQASDQVKDFSNKK